MMKVKSNRSKIKRTHEHQIMQDFPLDSYPHRSGTPPGLRVLSFLFHGTSAQYSVGQSFFGFNRRRSKELVNVTPSLCLRCSFILFAALHPLAPAQVRLRPLAPEQVGLKPCSSATGSTGTGCSLNDSFTLSNHAISATWSLRGGSLRWQSLTNHYTGASLSLDGSVFVLVPRRGRPAFGRLQNY